MLNVNIVPERKMLGMPDGKVYNSCHSGHLSVPVCNLNLQPGSH